MIPALICAAVVVATAIVAALFSTVKGDPPPYEPPDGPLF